VDRHRYFHGARRVALHFLVRHFATGLVPGPRMFDGSKIRDNLTQQAEARGHLSRDPVVAAGFIDLPDQAAVFLCL
jgi:hypothetical protein